ncbi:MAG TPA: amino acid racemase [Sphaerochaeta sp.]|nr:amino acid racemase [Sphaerochaeta sp.]HQB54657.1 amino acid racemase [Sphaerochaeta sp.]
MKAIGIIGGVGPMAGADAAQKIFENTNVATDQEHLDLYLTSTPRSIGDRTKFLLEGGSNPAEGLYRNALQLIGLGASTLIVPCNTAHAPPIFDVLRKKLHDSHPEITLLHMIEETAKHIGERFPEPTTIGLLATKGTHALKTYLDALLAYPHITLIEPTKESQERVHDAIYNQRYGIKAQAPVSKEALAILLEEAHTLYDRGAKALILGCTELPLALTKETISLPLIDPTVVLARSAIKHTEPAKLKDETA